MQCNRARPTAGLRGCRHWRAAATKAALLSSNSGSAPLCPAETPPPHPASLLVRKQHHYSLYRSPPPPFAHHPPHTSFARCSPHRSLTYPRREAVHKQSSDWTGRDEFYLVCQIKLVMLLLIGARGATCDVVLTSPLPAHPKHRHCCCSRRCLDPHPPFHSPRLRRQSPAPCRPSCACYCHARRVVCDEWATSQSSAGASFPCCQRSDQRPGPGQ